MLNVVTDLHKQPGRWPSSGASARVEPYHRHAVVPAGQGRARGHRGYGRQARHAGFVPNGVAHVSCQENSGRTRELGSARFGAHSLLDRR